MNSITLLPSPFAVRYTGVVLLIVSTVVYLEGCATASGPGPRESGDETSTPAYFFAALDAAVARAGVGDAGPTRVPGFAYLRVDRFLAEGVRPSPEDEVQYLAWVLRLQRLDQVARAKEIANLPPAERERLRPGANGARDLNRMVVNHGERLRTADLASPSRRRQLHESAAVPDRYNVGYRVLGLYPLTSMIFGRGVERLHAELGRDFHRPLEELDVDGRLVRYRPPANGVSLSPAEVAAVLERSERNPLGIPEPGLDDLNRLFHTFAPVFEVDVADADDRIGAPRWSADGLPTVEVSTPVVYRRVSHARFGARTLLQLNYVVWFPARARTGRFDLVGGRLDGITWRVTLDSDGRALLHDAMHNCGCYHMFFPSARIRYVPQRLGHEEPLLIAQVLDRYQGPLVIRVAHRTHYIQRVYSLGVSGGGTPYALAPYQELRSLPGPDGPRSLFRPDGIVPGTERGERYLFWPMGVPEPGAMRQWGHHAVAFVGRRHFDDPRLIGRYFERVRGASPS